MYNRVYCPCTIGSVVHNLDLVIFIKLELKECWEDIQLSNIKYWTDWPILTQLANAQWEFGQPVFDFLNIEARSKLTDVTLYTDKCTGDQLLVHNNNIAAVKSNNDTAAMPAMFFSSDPSVLRSTLLTRIQRLLQVTTTIMSRWGINPRWTFVNCKIYIYIYLLY